MITFQVNDMSCGHCTSAITRSVRAADPRAEVKIDLGQRLVTIEAATASPEALREAIVAAGYAASPVEARARDGGAARGGCCGGAPRR